MKDACAKASHRHHIRQSQFGNTISYLVSMFRRMVYLLSKLHLSCSHVLLVMAVTLKTNHFRTTGTLVFHIIYKITH
jgi:hypothetical protein